MNPPVPDGHYARKQIRCADPAIAWSHRSRFRIAARLVRTHQPRRMLDYGCGDGTFLATLAQGAGPPMVAWGADLAADQVEDCRKRFAGLPGHRFCLVGELDAQAPTGGFDAIVCMEVLEHVLDRVEVLRHLKGLLAPDGVLLLSVPVETGLALPVKQALRRMAGWRRLGDYKYQSAYTWSEMLRSVFAGRRQHIHRPVYGEAEGSPYHDHKGFNWKVLRDELSSDFTIERILSSPIAWLPAGWGSQVYFVARKRIP